MEPKDQNTTKPLVEPVVSREVAERDVMAWITLVGITEEQKESPQIKLWILGLMGFVMNGQVTIDMEKGRLTQKLRYSIGEEAVVNQLTYKPRITVADLQMNLLGVPAKDSYGQAIGYICASAGEAKAVIEKMDAKDYAVADCIAPFFMV